MSAADPDRELVDVSGFAGDVAELSTRLRRLLEGTRAPDAPVDYLLKQAIDSLQDTVEELRVSEEELRAQNEALVESRYQLETEHARYRELFDFAPAAYLVTDLRGIIREANAEALRLLNADAAFATGKPVAGFVAPPDRPSLRSMISRLPLVSGRREWEGDLAPRRRPPVPVNATVALVGGDDGRPEALRWIIRDVSDRRVVEGRAERLAAELREREPAGSEDAFHRGTLSLAGMLLDSAPLADQLLRVVSVARDLLPGAADAGALILESGAEPTSAATGDLARRLDAVQFRLTEGPADAALAEGRTQVSEDLPADPRWPRLANVATEEGCRSVLALPLLVRGGRLGVLTVYGLERGAFGAEAVRLGERFAEPAAAVLANAATFAGSERLSRELAEALTSRAVVEQAKGILMAQHGGTADAAFELLKAASQRQHLKLREVAARLVAQAGTLA